MRSLFVYILGRTDVINLYLNKVLISTSHLNEVTKRDF